MPLAKYMGGKGESVMRDMKARYGSEKGERVFYATANAMKNKPCKTCMGRKVEYHSPAKHPEQDDPYAAMDAMTEKAAKRQPGTMEQMRKEMKPMQQESSKPAKGLIEYLKKMGGGK
mgnify:FL=1